MLFAPARPDAVSPAPASAPLLDADARAALAHLRDLFRERRTSRGRKFGSRFSTALPGAAPPLFRA